MSGFDIAALMAQGANEASVFMVEAHLRIGTHPYYDAERFGIERLQQLERRAEYSIPELIEQSCWVLATRG